MAVTTGERRIVSVLVADVADSTGLGERLGPERSKFLFDEVVGLMSAQVRRFGGTVAQLTGDGLLAFFGAPLAHEDDSERAVRAGLAIQQALGDYAREVDDAYGVELAARVGVNTGPVVLSRDAEDGGDRYNALGDTVNVAARLQAAVGRGAVAVGAATARQVEDCFELEPLGALELKGKQSPLESFRVTGPRREDLERRELPIVGRDFELTVLERVLEDLVEGRGAIVSVMGEPGIGKSRLVSEVRRRFEGRIRSIEGRGVSYAEAFPYWPVRDLLREWLRVGVSTPEARVRLDLKAQLAHLFGDGAGDAYPFLAGLLGLTLEPDAAARVRELNREGVQSETFAVFGELVCRLSQTMPLCLVFEDLHWVDDSTLELLESLLPITDEHPVALFFLYRSEREHGSWHLGERSRQRYPHRYREIELRPLPPDVSRALAASAAEADLPPSVAELLTERAGGNPFFLEEALRDLVERGALRRDDGRLELTVGIDELAVPALVQGALQARLDRLEPKTREVVSVAAVIGRTFALPLLEHIVPRDELLPALSELQRLELIVETRRRPVPEYRFRHGLVQEVAYASLVETKRRRLHLSVGEALLDLRRDSPEEVYGLLARHFSEADAAEPAVEYLLKAGDAARALYADREALDHYRSARAFLTRLADDGRARETLFKIALTHHLAFDFEQAEDAYDEAFCCRVPELSSLDPTERLETVSVRPDDFVPGHTYSTEGAQLAEHLFRGLLLVDADLNVVPAMADNFRVSGDGLTYLFSLRDGARWSDGVPVTAGDFSFAWQRRWEQEAATAFLLEDVVSVEALDDRTLEIRLREPRSYFPYLLASHSSFPWPRHKVEELGDAWREPEHLVSNGPFTLAELDDRHALLVANPYWAGPRGNVREVDVVWAAKSADALEPWCGGRFDLVEVEDSALAGEPDTVLETTSLLLTAYVGFRTSAPPFSNELVRRAFAHALDRGRLASSLSGSKRAATRGGAIPPAMPGHSHRVGLAYDPELARRLLANAGYKDGRGLPELELAVPEWAEGGEAFVEQWGEELGARIRVTAGHVPFGEAASAHHWLSRWTADYPDPDGFFRGLLRAGREVLYSDEEIDELLDSARSCHDRDDRFRLYGEIDRLWVAEHAAIVPVWYGRKLLARRPWIDGVWLNPLGRIHLDDVVVERLRVPA